MAKEVPIAEKSLLTPEEAAALLQYRCQQNTNDD